MRASQFNIGINPFKIIDANDRKNVFMVMNRSLTDNIYLQFGNSPGNSVDAWPIRPGDVFVLDNKGVPTDTIWIWADVANINNVILMG